MTDIRTRKDEHLDIVLSGKARSGRTSPFDAIELMHHALPDFALADVDLSTPFLGRTLKAPYLISAMTGGPARADRINAALADAAQDLGVALAVGSQRVALEDAGVGGLGRDLRRRAPDIPLLANIGMAQVALWNDPTRALAAVDMIEADALIVHLNPLQEAIQGHGDTDWRGARQALGALCAAAPVPIIAKEVGAGISAAAASDLMNLGVTVIDVAGRGGTSWAAVEAERASEARQRQMAAPFRDWGIATTDAIAGVRALSEDVCIIGSGGIRDGVDAAKAIRLGANLVGQAAGVLHAALTGPDAARDTIAALLEQLRIACFCTGARNLDALRAVPFRADPPLWRP